MNTERWEVGAEYDEEQQASRLRAS